MTDPSDTGWLLIVFNVPDHLRALVQRFGFKPSRKNPTHWWCRFDPKTDKPLAVRIRDHFRAAGLKGKWKQVAAKSDTAPISSMFTRLSRAAVRVTPPL